MEGTYLIQHLTFFLHPLPQMLGVIAAKFRNSDLEMATLVNAY